MTGTMSYVAIRILTLFMLSVSIASGIVLLGSTGQSGRHQQIADYVATRHTATSAIQVIESIQYQCELRRAIGFTDNGNRFAYLTERLELQLGDLTPSASAAGISVNRESLDRLLAINRQILDLHESQPDIKITDNKYETQAALSAYAKVELANVSAIAKSEADYAAQNATPLILPFVVSTIGVFLSLAIQYLVWFRYHNNELDCVRISDEPAHVDNHVFGLLDILNHELRSPISSIASYIDSEVESVTGDDAHFLSDDLQGHYSELSSALDKISCMSSLIRGTVQSVPKQVRGADLVHQLVQTVNDVATPKAVRIKNAESPHVTVTVDEQLATSCVRYLTKAALMYAGDRELELCCSVSSRSRSRRCVIEIMCRSSGIHPEDLDKIRSAIKKGEWQRLPQSLSRNYNSLIIATEFAQSLGGKIAVSSIFEVEAKFTVEIPVGIDASGTDDLQRPSMLEAELEAGRRDEMDADQGRVLEGCRILVAEDSSEIQNLVKHCLRGQGAEVRCVTNGDDLINELIYSVHEKQWDLLLVDLNMPGRSGDSVIRELRSEGIHVPAIAVTAQADQQTRARCLNSGFNDFTSKPFSRDQLVQVCLKWARVAQCR